MRSRPRTLLPAESRSGEHLPCRPCRARARRSRRRSRSSRASRVAASAPTSRTPGGRHGRERPAAGLLVHDALAGDRAHAPSASVAPTVARSQPETARELRRVVRSSGVRRISSHEPWLGEQLGRPQLSRLDPAAKRSTRSSSSGALRAKRGKPSRSRGYRESGSRPGRRLVASIAPGFTIGIVHPSAHT